MTFMFLKKMYHRLSKKHMRLEKVFIVISAVSLIDIFISFLLPKYQYPWVAVFLRPIIVIILVRSLRESLNRFILVIYDSISLLLFIILYVVFFSWLGVRLFRGTVEGVQYYSGFLISCYNNLILL